MNAVGGRRRPGIRTRGSLCARAVPMAPMGGSRNWAARSRSMEDSGGGLAAADSAHLFAARRSHVQRSGCFRNILSSLCTRTATDKTPTIAAAKPFALRSPGWGFPSR